MAKETLNLEADEHIIFEIRKHWIVFINYAVSLLVYGLLPSAVFFFISNFYPNILGFSFSGNIWALFVFLYCIWFLFLWVSFFMNWTKYYLDVWYVTEKRIIAVDQRRIFDRGISNLRFDKIQDVTIDVRGIIPTFLNYGNVKVQTAGEDNYEFSMYAVQDPEKVRRIIFNQHNEIGDKNRAVF